MSIILYISTHVFPSCHQQACLSLCLCILSLFFSLRTVRDGKKRERMRGCVFDRHFRSLYDRVLYTLRCSAHHLFSPCNPCCVCCWLVAHFESRDSLSPPSLLLLSTKAVKTGQKNDELTPGLLLLLPNYSIVYTEGKEFRTKQSIFVLEGEEEEEENNKQRKRNKNKIHKMKNNDRLITVKKKQELNVRLKKK